MDAWVLLVIWAGISVAPLIHAWLQRTPMTLGIGASLILAHFAQILVEMRYGFDLMTVIGALNPAWIDEWWRLITAGWLHANLLHLLGNLLVIILVGVPLEQRLGRGRFLIIYMVGVLGGNIGWATTHWGEFGFALGASGAAFGLLGCYLACWPRDEIEFPLILIRRWPVAWIALFKFGHEVFMYGFLSGETNIAHLAHLTGFFACYVLAKPIAKGGLVPIGTHDQGPSTAGSQEAIQASIKARMGDLSSDPWDGNLKGNTARTLRRLREEGDEIETRQAWLEELAEQAHCPICESPLKPHLKQGVTRLRCSSNSSHLNWP